jgi:hypothetical protein
MMCDYRPAADGFIPERIRQYLQEQAAIASTIKITQARNYGLVQSAKFMATFCPGETE